jgi:hypothetical protein
MYLQTQYLPGVADPAFFADLDPTSLVWIRLRILLFKVIKLKCTLPCLRRNFAPSEIICKELKEVHY